MKGVFSAELVLEAVSPASRGSVEIRCDMAVEGNLGQEEVPRFVRLSTRTCPSKASHGNFSHRKFLTKADVSDEDGARGSDGPAS